MSALWMLSGMLIGFGAAHVSAAEPFWALMILAGCFAAVGGAAAERERG